MTYDFETIARLKRLASSEALIAPLKAAARAHLIKAAIELYYSEQFELVFIPESIIDEAADHLTENGKPNDLWQRWQDYQEELKLLALED